MATIPDGDLFPDVRNPENIQVINERCLLRTQHGHRVVIVAGMVLSQYAVGDRMSEAHAMVSLGVLSIVLAAPNGMWRWLIFRLMS